MLPHLSLSAAHAAENNCESDAETDASVRQQIRDSIERQRDLENYTLPSEYTSLPSEEVRSQFRALREKLERMIEEKTVLVMPPPSGRYLERLTKLLDLDYIREVMTTDPERFYNVPLPKDETGPKTPTISEDE